MIEHDVPATIYYDEGKAFSADTMCIAQGEYLYTIIARAEIIIACGMAYPRVRLMHDTGLVIELPVAGFKPLPDWRSHPSESADPYRGQPEPPSWRRWKDEDKKLERQPLPGRPDQTPVTSIASWVRAPGDPNEGPVATPAQPA